MPDEADRFGRRFGLAGFKCDQHWLLQVAEFGEREHVAKRQVIVAVVLNPPAVAVVGFV